MKLYVIVRNIDGEFYGGLLSGNLRIYTSNKQLTRELIPTSLSFEVYRKINRKEDVANIDKFITVSEFRKRTGYQLPVKFSQIVLDNLGLDRVWIFKDCKI